MNKKVWLVACVLLTLVALSFPVDALGITTLYYPGNSLTLQAGQTKTISLGLTNMAGDPQNLTVIANITKGGEIAQLVEKNKQYLLPFGTNNNIGIELIISVPLGEQVGKEYEVEVTITTITPGGSGVVLGSSIGTTIPVTIVSSTGETTKKEQFPIEWVILIVLIAIILLVIIIAILSKKKKQKK